MSIVWLVFWLSFCFSLLSFGIVPKPPLKHTDSFEEVSQMLGRGVSRDLKMSDVSLGLDLG